MLEMIKEFEQIKNKASKDLEEIKSNFRNNLLNNFVDVGIKEIKAADSRGDYRGFGEVVESLSKADIIIKELGGFNNEVISRVHTATRPCWTNFAKASHFSNQS